VRGQSLATKPAFVPRPACTAEENAFPALQAAKYIPHLVNEPLDRIVLPLARCVRGARSRAGNVELRLGVDQALAQSLLEHFANDR
jgi:hypothetical protein